MSAARLRLRELKTIGLPNERQQSSSRREIVVTGRWLRVATIRDEELVEGQVAPDPEALIDSLKASGTGADVLSFPQNLDDRTPHYSYPFDWDNAAVAYTDSFDSWWEKLPQVTRKNVRRSAKRGVLVRAIEFDDEAVRALKAIYDETPFRQGARFPHYQKALEIVRAENATYNERCEYIGAYYEDKLIGFMRFVYVDRIAKIMQILASLEHADKRPMNAMIAKAVEICHAKGMTCLVYSRFRFGNKKASPLAEFKRRNGFEEVLFPRYYVPLNWKGQVAVKLNLHRGLLGLLPSGLLDLLLRWRTSILHSIRQSPDSGESGQVGQTTPV